MKTRNILGNFIHSYLPRLLIRWMLYWIPRVGRSKLPPKPGDVDNIVLWNIDPAGDLLCSTPLLESIRHGYSNAKITFICNQDYYFPGDRECHSLLSTNPNIDCLISVPFHFFPSLLGLFRTIRLLRKAKIRNVDLMIVVGNFAWTADQGKLLAGFLGAKYCVSTPYGALNHIPQYLLPPNSDDALSYWPDYFQKFTHHLGVKNTASRITIYEGQNDIDATNRLLSSWRETNTDDLPLLGIHPFVAWYGKEVKKWPHEHFVTLCLEILKLRKVRIVIGGSNHERGEAEAMQKRINEEAGISNVISIAGQLSLRTYFSLIKRYSAMITNDTSAMHLAAAANIPTAGIFGATDPRLLAERNVLGIKKKLPCQPCFKYRQAPPFWPTCIYPETRCLTELSPLEILPMILSLLDRKHNAHSLKYELVKITT